jgi:uncharacterized membrane protein
VKALSNIKIVLEIIVIMVFLLLLIHVARRDGHRAVLGLMAPKA